MGGALASEVTKCMQYPLTQNRLYIYIDIFFFLNLTHNKVCYCSKTSFGDSLKFVKVAHLKRMKFTADSSFRIEFVHTSNTSGGCSRGIASVLKYFT